MNINKIINDIIAIHGRDFQFNNKKGSIVEEIVKDLDLYVKLKLFTDTVKLDIETKKESPRLLEELTMYLYDKTKARDNFLNCYGIDKTIAINEGMKLVHWNGYQPENESFGQVLDEIYKLFIYYILGTRYEMFSHGMVKPLGQESNYAIDKKFILKHNIALEDSDFSHIEIIDTISMTMIVNSTFDPRLNLSHKVKVIIHNSYDEKYNEVFDYAVDKIHNFQFSSFKSPKFLLFDLKSEFIENNLKYKSKYHRINENGIFTDIPNNQIVHNAFVFNNTNFTYSNFKKSLGQPIRGTFQELSTFDDVTLSSRLEGYEDVFNMATNQFQVYRDTLMRGFDTYGNLHNLFNNSFQSLSSDNTPAVQRFVENNLRLYDNNSIFTFSVFNYRMIINYIYNYCIIMSCGRNRNSGRFLHPDNIKDIREKL